MILWQHIGIPDVLNPGSGSTPCAFSLTWWPPPKCFSNPTYCPEAEVAIGPTVWQTQTDGLSSKTKQHTVGDRPEVDETRCVFTRWLMKHSVTITKTWTACEKCLSELDTDDLCGHRCGSSTFIYSQSFKLLCVFLWWNMMSTQDRSGSLLWLAEFWSSQPWRCRSSLEESFKYMNMKNSEAMSRSTNNLVTRGDAQALWWAVSCSFFLVDCTHQLYNSTEGSVHPLRLGWRV